jgi:hypothetical protein
MDMGMLRAILPGDAGSSAIVRFSGNDPAATPRGQPIRVGLLSLIDLAIIFTSVAYTLTLCDDQLPTARSVEALFDDLSDHLSPQAQPGLSERDVQGLRDALMARWPEHPRLGALSAAKFWEHFQDVAPHLADQHRRQALACLWGNHTEATALFQRLCEGLDKLAHGLEAYCGPDALVGKDTASGWMTRHPRSILDGATVLALEGGSGHPVSVVNRFGQTIELDRAVIAALMAELPLHLTGTRLSELAPADVLDFPVVMPISDRHLPSIQRLPSRDAQRGEANIRAQIIAHYLHMKAIYLFERACLNHEVTSLVVIADPSRDDDTHSDAIANWVASAQGGDAHARERVRRGLFVAVAEHLVEPTNTFPPLDAAGNATGQLDQGDFGAVQRLLRDVIGAGQDWPTMWTPNRPISEIVVFPAHLPTPPNRSGGVSMPTRAPLMRSDDRATLDVASQQLQRASSQERISAQTARRSGLVVANSAQSSLSELASQRQALPQLPDTGVRTVLDLNQLIKALGIASDERQKHQQLSQRLRNIRRAIRHTLIRYHASNDPPALAHWRRGTATVVQDRLQLLTERGRLGHLQRALLPSEADLITAMTAATHRQPETSPTTSGRWSPIASPTPGFQDSAAARSETNAAVTARLCERAVSSWISGIRRAGRAQRLCRDLKIQDSVFQHLIDEVQIGAARIGLAGEIGMAFQRANDLNGATRAALSGQADHTGHNHTDFNRNDIIRLAAYASRLITAYVETLDNVSVRANGSWKRGSGSEIGDANTTDIATPTLRQRPTATRLKQSGKLQWEAQFTNLVEGNIASAHLLVGRGEKDRELGELLQLFASGPFEVET